MDIDGKVKSDPFEIEASGVSIALGIALKETLDSLVSPEEEPPSLVLLGDVLDLSLSPPARSYRVFETFVQSLFVGPENKNKDIRLSKKEVYFVPGNHDHTLWTALKYQPSASEADKGYIADTEERGIYSRFKGVSPAFQLPDPQYQSWLLQELFQTATGVEIDVPVYYPNLGRVNADNSRAVVMHHGHYIEATYKLLSIVFAGFHGRECGPIDVEQLERENGNWIDFGWSTLGENGPIGQDIASFYQFLLTGSHQGRLQTRLSDALSDKLMEVLPIPKTNQMRHLVSIASKATIDATVGQFSQTERLSYLDYLGRDSVKGLREYLLGAVGQQMVDWFFEDQPQQTTFIFGHTHKPFMDHFIVDGRTPNDSRDNDDPIFSRPVEVYNTGGWILDTSLLSTKEGASIVFVDDDMNVAELRAFNISPSREIHPPTVQSLVPGNPMEEKLTDAVNDNKDVWERFSRVVTEALKLRQKALLAGTTESDNRVAPPEEVG